MANFGTLAEAFKRAGRGVPDAGREVPDAGGEVSDAGGEVMAPGATGASSEEALAEEALVDETLRFGDGCMAVLKEEEGEDEDCQFYRPGARETRMDRSGRGPDGTGTSGDERGLRRATRPGGRVKKTDQVVDPSALGCK